MTLEAIRQTIRSKLLRSTAHQSETAAADAADLRREYVMSSIAAGCCVGEFGVMALMQLSPKDT